MHGLMPAGSGMTKAAAKRSKRSGAGAQQRGLAPARSANDDQPPPEVIRQAAEIMKQAGRYEDEEIAHVAPGEIIIPLAVQDQFPDLMPTIRQMFVDAGLDPDRYVVADTAGPNHRITGLEEFFSEGDGPNGMGADGESAGHGGSDPGGNDAEASTGRAESPSGRSGAVASAGEQSDNSNAADNPSDGEAGGHGGGAQDFSFETTLSKGQQTAARSYGLNRSQAHNTQNQNPDMSIADVVDAYAQARHAHNPTPQQRAMNRATLPGFVAENPNVLGLTRALATLAGFAVPGFGAITTAANLGNAVTGQPSVSFGLSDLADLASGSIPDVSVDGLAPANTSTAGVGEPTVGPGPGGRGLMPTALAGDGPQFNDDTGAQEFFSREVVLDSGVKINFTNEQEYNDYASMLDESGTGHQDLATVEQAASDAGQSLEEYRGDMAHAWNSPGGKGFADHIAQSNPLPGGASFTGLNPSSPGDGTTSTTTDRLNAILSSDSPLMQGARARGMMAANRRGLLNSTMAAKAGEAAMIDAAVPLALQEGQVASTEYQQGQQIGHEQSLQANDISNQQFMQGQQIGHEQSLQANDIELQQWLKLSDNDLQLALQNNDIASDHWIAQLDADTRTAIANLQVGASDREKIGAMVAAVQQNYTTMYTAILNNPDLPSEQRDDELVHVENVLLNGIELIEQTYGVDLVWNGSTITEG
jgi:hypothetical protein